MHSQKFHGQNGQSKSYHDDFYNPDFFVVEIVEVVKISADFDLLTMTIL
jgi:hypothetical protein